MFFAVIAGLIAVLIPFSAPIVRQHRALRQAVAFVLLVHQIISILQVALNGLPTMKMDPMSFNSFAMWGEGRLAHNSYAQFLHIVYSTFGPSHLLGCQISNIFFSLALVVQIYLLASLGYQETLPQLILVFGLLPSCVLNTSVTLREAAQMFCYLSIALLLLKVCREGFSARTLLLVPITVLLIHLHQGMAALVIVVIPLSLAIALQARPIVLAALIIVTLSTGVLVKDRVIETLTEKSTVLNRLSEGDLQYLEKYADNVGESRSSFGVSLDLSSPSGFLKTGPLLLVYYLFSPLPWQIRGFLDIYGFVESILRILLFLSAVRTLRTSVGTERREYLLLALLFCAMETAWAIGTANWGTAFRHRLVAWGVLVAAGGSLFGETRHLLTDSKSVRRGKPSVRMRRRALSGQLEGQDQGLKTSRQTRKRR